MGIVFISIVAVIIFAVNPASQVKAMVTAQWS